MIWIALYPACFCFSLEREEERRKKKEERRKKKEKREKEKGEFSPSFFSFSSSEKKKLKGKRKKNSLLPTYRADPRQHVAGKLEVRVHLGLGRRHPDVALVDAQRARPLRPRVRELVRLVRRRRHDARRGLAWRLVVDAVELDLVPLLRGLSVVIENGAY